MLLKRLSREMKIMSSQRTFMITKNAKEEILNKRGRESSGAPILSTPAKPTRPASSITVMEARIRAAAASFFFSR
ncbi:hypothetical protein ES708_16086 [subsurface metagenome]